MSVCTSPLEGRGGRYSWSGVNCWAISVSSICFDKKMYSASFWKDSCCDGCSRKQGIKDFYVCFLRGFSNYYYHCAFRCMWVCMPPHTCGSRRTWELGLSCHQVVPRDQTRVVRFGGKHLDPLSHPTDLMFVLKYTGFCDNPSIILSMAPKLLSYLSDYQHNVPRSNKPSEPSL